MSKKGLLENNEKKRRLAQKLHDRRSQLKSIVMDRSISLEQRFEASLKLAQLPRNSSSIRYRTRCVATGRPRAVYRFCGLSRIALREMATRGTLPGMRRSSW